jgi:hypothetical protein
LGATAGGREQWHIGGKKNESGTDRIMFLRGQARIPVAVPASFQTDAEAACVAPPRPTDGAAVLGAVKVRPGRRVPYGQSDMK